MFEYHEIKKFKDPYDVAVCAARIKVLKIIIKYKEEYENKIKIHNELAGIISEINNSLENNNGWEWIGGTENLPTLRITNNNGYLLEILDVELIYEDIIEWVRTGEYLSEIY